MPTTVKGDLVAPSVLTIHHLSDADVDYIEAELLAVLSAPAMKELCDTYGVDLIGQALQGFLRLAHPHAPDKFKLEEVLVKRQDNAQLNTTPKYTSPPGGQFNLASHAGPQQSTPTPNRFQGYSLNNQQSSAPQNNASQGNLRIANVRTAASNKFLKDN